MSVAELITRRCACGCGATFQCRPASRRRHLDGHRQRGYRRRVRREMEAAGLPANPSLKVAGQGRTSRDRNGDAQSTVNARQTGTRRARRPSDERFSSARVLDVLRQRLGRTEAEELVERMRTDAQRARRAR